MLKKLFFITFALFSLQGNAALNIQQWQTSSGADVYFVENHDLPIIDLSTNFRAGSAQDTPEKSGVAGITKYLMTLGAGGMSEEQISNRLADIGAQMGGDIDADMANFRLRTLSSAIEQEKALAIYTAILQKPDFSAEILVREKQRILAGLKEAETQPESISDSAFKKALFANHPYGLEEGGQVATVDKITVEDLKSFYAKNYGAKNAVIALMGDMSRAQASAIAERISSGLSNAAKINPPADVQKPVKPIEIRISHPATQAHILLGYPGIKRGDSDFYALYVGNYILGGGGFVSRLTEEVREKRGLVYSVYSYFMPMSAVGPFQVGLQTKKEQADEALKLVRETISTFIKGGINEAELKAAKQNIVGGFPMRIDSNAKILDYLAVIGFYKLPLTYLDDFNANIGKVTSAQIRDAFNRRIKPENFVTVVVGGL